MRRGCWTTARSRRGWISSPTTSSTGCRNERIRGRAAIIADTVSKPGELALFEETKETLRTRVARLATGMAWSEVPPSRTRHLVTNVQVESGENESELRVRSYFMVYRTQLEHSQDVFVGERDDVLRKVGDDWKIARRTIILDQAVLQSPNLSIFF